jgi:hypothetical protein
MRRFDKKSKKDFLILGLLLVLLNLVFFINNYSHQLCVEEKIEILNKQLKTSVRVWTNTGIVSTESSENSGSVRFCWDNNNNIHFVWADATNISGCNSVGEGSDIFYKLWNRTSNTWTSTEVVSTESNETSWYPTIAADNNGNVHVTWMDLTNYSGCKSVGENWNVFYKRRNATSDNWTITDVVSTECTTSSGSPSIVVDTIGNAHIVWDDNTDYNGSGTDTDIFYKLWNSTIDNWTITEVVSVESNLTSAGTSFVIDNAGNAHLVWADNTNYSGSGADKDIFYKLWNSTNNNWTKAVVVSTESSDLSRYPSIAIDNSLNVYVTWMDWTDYGGSGSDDDIFYKLWNATSKSWTTTEVISTESTSDSWEPSIAVDQLGNIHLTWEDYTNLNGSGIDDDIFYKLWNATSKSWTTTEVISTESTSLSSEPDVLVDTQGYLYITWHDVTNYGGSGGDMDIFYKMEAHQYLQ